MTDFEIHWQNYFTALDELAKATVALCEEAVRSPMQINAQVKLAHTGAQLDFYRAHLALKPFLEDDSE